MVQPGIGAPAGRAAPPHWEVRPTGRRQRPAAVRPPPGGRGRRRSGSGGLVPGESCSGSAGSGPRPEQAAAPCSDRVPSFHLHRKSVSSPRGLLERRFLWRRRRFTRESHDPGQVELLADLAGRVVPDLPTHPGGLGAAQRRQGTQPGQTPGSSGEGGERLAAVDVDRRVARRATTRPSVRKAASTAASSASSSSSTAGCRPEPERRGDHEEGLRRNRAGPVEPGQLGAERQTSTAACSRRAIRSPG